MEEFYYPERSIKSTYISQEGYCTINDIFKTKFYFVFLLFFVCPKKSNQRKCTTSEATFPRGTRGLSYQNSLIKITQTVTPKKDIYPTRACQRTPFNVATPLVDPSRTLGRARPGVLFILILYETASLMEL